MIDIGKQKIDMKCPNCRRSIKISLDQVSRQQIVRCNSCSQDIQLQDSRGSAKKGVREMNKAFKDLERTLKSFGK
ncbi:MJ0042-type zinc finger domain-containing protein [Reichenbachiella carrageenanivorans]|uniref:MJ0042-type zinc finger domain-containing protein n=1 Tax=Reichenbachiella carrageenanivorans TaxID=2979869 RepID=UPI00389B3712